MNTHWEYQCVELCVCTVLRLDIIFHYYNRNEYRYMTFILLFIDLAGLDEMEKHYITILLLQIKNKNNV